jgi:hypothetical protein
MEDEEVDEVILKTEEEEEDLRSERSESGTNQFGIQGKSPIGFSGWSYGPEAGTWLNPTEGSGNMW